MSVKKAAKPPLKVAIVGAAPSSRDLAPYSDTTWEIWGCSPSNRNLPRITAWFEIHAAEDLKSKRWEPWAKSYIEWMKTQPRVYMQETNDLVPNALAFPKAELIAKYGQLMLTSSIAWQIGLAMLLGASEIGIWGVDMAANTEYDYERPGCKYWIQQARAAGINVFVPPQSDLDVPAPLYGFDDAKPEAIKLKTYAMELTDRIEALAKRAAEIDAEKAVVIREHQHLSGVLDGVNFVRKSYISFSGPDMR